MKPEHVFLYECNTTGIEICVKNCDFVWIFFWDECESESIE